LSGEKKKQVYPGKVIYQKNTLCVEKKNSKAKQAEKEFFYQHGSQRPEKKSLRREKPHTKKKNVTRSSANGGSAKVAHRVGKRKKRGPIPHVSSVSWLGGEILWGTEKKGVPLGKDPFLKGGNGCFRAAGRQ